MDLTAHLFEWLTTFDLGGVYSDSKQLCDGVAIANALVHIAPEYFSSSLTSKIEPKCNNWYFRASNLRKIYASLVDYYSEVLEKTIPDNIQPDLDSIAKEYDNVQLGKLLQLILGCAINCLNKEKHIEVMTTLSLEVKHSLKVAIDELENIEENNAANDPTPSLIKNEEIAKLREDVNKAKVEKEKAIERCIDMENMVSKLQEEKQNLKSENEKLILKSEVCAKLVTNDSNLRFDSIEHEALFQRLNSQLNQYQCELLKMEERKEDYKINLEIKEKEYHKIVIQNEQLLSKLNEYKQDRDELDRLRYLNEEFIKYKNITEAQKKKLEEFQELKKQIRLLEERNTSLVQQICELEEEKKNISMYKGQVEIMKKQREELRSKMNEEIFRADKAEDELKRLYEKYKQIQQDNEKKIFELQSLKTEVASLQKVDGLNGASIDQEFSSKNFQGLSNAPTIIATGGHSFKSNFSQGSTELNERLTRLQFENKKLKESNDEKLVLLEGQLEDEKQQISRLEAENRVNNQKIIELQGQLKEIKATTNFASETTNGGGQEVITLQNKLKELQEQLTEKDERFKKHVNKAKETMDVLMSHANNKLSNSLPDTSRVQSDDVNYLKNLVSQKEAEIERLRGEYESKIAFREIEENLMTVNYHNLTFNLHRKATDDRMMANNYNSNSTFLSRQRQASSKKFIINSSDLSE